MGGFSHLEVQKALYTLLTGDATLMGSVSGIYDFVPESAAYPFVTLGDIAARDWSTKSGAGMQLTASVHVHSRNTGRKEALTLMERIYTLLNQASFSVTGQQLVAVRYLEDEVVQERDGLGYRGTVRFNLYTESN